jgi:hypothetical protein
MSVKIEPEPLARHPSRQRMSVAVTPEDSLSHGRGGPLPWWFLSLIAVAVPTIALIAFASVFVSDGVNVHKDYVWLEDNVPIVKPILKFVHETQKERGVTMVSVNALTAKEKGTWDSNLKEQRDLTDMGSRDLQSQIGKLDPAVLLHPTLQIAISTWRQLGTFRAAADMNTTSNTELLAYYNQLHLQWIDSIGVISSFCKVPSIIVLLRALVQFTTVKEYNGHVRASGVVVIQRRSYATVDDIMSTAWGLDGVTTMERSFLATAPIDFAQEYTQKILAADSVKYVRRTANAFKTFNSSLFESNINDWFGNCTEQINIYLEVELRHLDALLASAQQESERSQKATDTTIGGLVACIVISICTAIVTERVVSHNRSIERAKRESDDLAAQSADAIARMDLEAVAYLREIQKPTSIQCSFMKIVVVLKKYRAFLPQAVYTDQLDTSDDATDSSDEELQSPQRSAAEDDIASQGSRRSVATNDASRLNDLASLSPCMIKRLCTIVHVFFEANSSEMKRIFEARGSGDVLHEIEQRLTFINRAAAKEKGVLLRFTEDEVSVGFNVVGRLGMHCANGCNTALRIHSSAQNFRNPLSVAVAVHTSNALCGFAGSQQTRAVLAYTRDLALLPLMSRLSLQLNKVITTPSALCVRSQFHLTPIPEHPVSDGDWIFCKPSESVLYTINDRGVSSDSHPSWLYTGVPEVKQERVSPPSSPLL